MTEQDNDWDLPAELEDREEDEAPLDEIDASDTPKTLIVSRLPKRGPRPRSGLNKEQRITARSRAVQAALLGLNHRQNVHYTQGSRRWSGIRYNLRARRGRYPSWADCSAYATWCLWNGLYVSFGVKDIVNRANWKAGFTGTLLRNGVKVSAPNAQRADVVVYGRRNPGNHCAIIVGRRKRDNKPMVVSFGSERGPYYLPYDYRRDIMSIRRYI